MSYDQCGVADPGRGTYCGLPLGHKGRHEDSWGRRFDVAPESGNREAREPSGTLSTGSKAGTSKPAPGVGAPTGAVGEWCPPDLSFMLSKVEEHVAQTYGAWEPDRLRAMVASIRGVFDDPDYRVQVTHRQAAGAIERLAAIIADADSAVSCMFHRGSKSWGEMETCRLIATLRNEAPKLLDTIRKARGQTNDSTPHESEEIQSKSSEV